MSFAYETSIQIDAPKEKVWKVLTNPDDINKWFFGTTIETDWVQGGPIVFRGEWGGQSYKDEGIIKKIEAMKALHFTHLSSRANKPAESENYELIKFDLIEEDGNRTQLVLTEENLPSAEAREKSSGLWKEALKVLKGLAEA